MTMQRLLLRTLPVVLATASLLYLPGCGGVSTTVKFDGSGKAVIDSDQTLNVTASATPSGSVTYTLSGPGTLVVSHTIFGDQELYGPPQGLTASASATVTARAGGSSSTYAITVNPAIVFAAQTLAAPSVGRAYSATIAASQGTGTLSYAVSSGSLPAGLALSQTGVLSGTPTAMGTYTFAIQVQDQADTPVKKLQTFTVAVS